MFNDDTTYYNLSKTKKILVQTVCIGGGLFIGFVTGSVILITRGL